MSSGGFTKLQNKGLGKLAYQESRFNGERFPRCPVFENWHCDRGWESVGVWRAASAHLMPSTHLTIKTVKGPFFCHYVPLVCVSGKHTQTHAHRHMYTTPHTGLSLHHVFTNTQTTQIHTHPCSFSHTHTHTHTRTRTRTHTRPTNTQ